ncbi:hypothetical protein LCGC14_0969800 [marine sediment metagenome]|uniref:HD domain-containing protein n=1 Tax=marine sediment metagenome TaxID=412755 RepID=A0A0F9QV41_9ZZZZ
MVDTDQEAYEEKLGDTKKIGPMDPTFHLLKEFREQAPGSHKHAQSLVSMVENVCAAIDVDADILKMAAMYHDIGKMWSPSLFTENQGKDNIHDGLPAWTSYELIAKHVSDTVAILFINEFPKDVIRIASQHHGTCVVQAIFESAKAEDSGVDPDAFRYKTQNPDSLESLILMFCDQVEATSRAIYASDGDHVEPAVFVLNIYNKLHADGQFDNVRVLLGKLKKIQAALITDVSSNFQKRIKYEEDEILVGKTREE